MYKKEEKEGKRFRKMRKEIKKDEERAKEDELGFRIYSFFSSSSYEEDMLLSLL